MMNMLDASERWGWTKDAIFCEAHTEEQKITCGGRGTKWMASNLRGGERIFGRRKTNDNNNT